MKNIEPHYKRIWNYTGRAIERISEGIIGEPDRPTRRRLAKQTYQGRIVIALRAAVSEHQGSDKYPDMCRTCLVQMPCPTIKNVVDVLEGGTHERRITRRAS